MHRARLVTASAVAVVSIASVAACGDNGTGIVSQPPAITTPEWIVEVDAICAASNVRIAALEAPESEPSLTLTERELASWAEYLESVLAIQSESSAAFDELGTPAGDATSEIRTLLAMREDGIALEQDAAAAARAGDAAAFRLAHLDLDDRGEELTAASADVGLEVCGQPDSEGPIEPSPRTVPLAEWTAEVSARCADHADELDELAEPAVEAEDATEKDLPEIAVYLREVHQLTLETVDDIAAAGLPVEYEAEAEALVDELGDVVAAIGDALDAAQEGDLEAFDAAAISVGDAVEDLAPVVETLDVEECRL